MGQQKSLEKENSVHTQEKTGKREEKRTTHKNQKTTTKSTTTTNITSYFFFYPFSIHSLTRYTIHISATSSFFPPPPHFLHIFTHFHRQRKQNKTGHKVI